MWSVEKTMKRKPYKRTFYIHSTPEKTTTAERSGLFTQVTKWGATFVLLLFWFLIVAVWMTGIFIYSVISLATIVLVTLVEKTLSWFERR